MSPQESPTELIQYWERPKQRFTRVRRLLDRVTDLLVTYSEAAYLDDEFNRWDIYPDPYDTSRRTETADTPAGHDRMRRN